MHISGIEGDSGNVSLVCQLAHHAQKERTFHTDERIIARRQMNSARSAYLHNLFDTKPVSAPVLPFTSIQPLCVDDSPLPARAASVYPEAVPAPTGKLPRVDAPVWIDTPAIPLTGDTESASVLGINGSKFVPQNRRVFLA